MISVLSSYKVYPASEPGEILPELEHVCQELYSRGFLGVDVVLSRSDLNAACDGAEARACNLIERRIRECVEFWGKSGEYVPLKVCALATNFPGISSVDKAEQAWEDAVRYLAVCLVVAHRLGTRVVEIVCGARIYTHHDGRQLFISSLNDKSVINCIQSRFAEGVYKAFCKAEQILGLRRWPNVGLAIEMEPDEVALTRTIDDVSLLLAKVNKVLRKNGDFGKRSHFGINVDWGHLLLACDAGYYGRDRMALQRCLSKLEKPGVKRRIMHAHVADHFPGAHRADAPIGTFRQMDAYWPLMDFYARLLKQFVGKSRAVNQFFTGALGIELEARQEIGEAVKCRDALIKLGEKLADDTGAHIGLSADAMPRPNDGETAFQLETEKDRLRQVEQSIARAGKSEGWLQGINRTIFDALSDLQRSTKTPDRYALLDDEMLETIREFLSSSEPDTRTERAMNVACGVLRKLGAEILAFWLTDLLDEEWGKNFYKQYRDHTIHSVYVYLLGLYLFAVSPKIREMIFKEDKIKKADRMNGPALITFRGGEEIPTFFAKWALASLTHDIGYPFEAGGEALLNARKKLRETFWRLPQLLCALRNAPRINREDVTKYADPGLQILKNGVGDEINASFDALGSVFFLEKERELEVPERTGGGLNAFEDEIVERRLERSFLANQPKDLSLMRVFNFMRGNKPKKRDAFLDHGFMSAAVLHELVRLCQWWADGSKVDEACEQLLKVGTATALTMKDELKNWRQQFLAAGGNKNVDKFLREVYLAIMIHNITPDRFLDGSSGFLYDKAQKKDDGPVLKTLRDLKPNYKSMRRLLPFLLTLCDLLHEWHRFGFVNPLRLKHRTLSALQVAACREANNDLVVFTYKTSDAVDDNSYRDARAKDKVDPATDGRSFWYHKQLELTRQFDTYWLEFVRIEETGPRFRPLRNGSKG